MLRGDYGRERGRRRRGRRFAPALRSRSKSLVRRSDFGRYELHELLRQYSAERLAAESTDALSATRERHARHYLGALDERRGALLGSGVARARDELRRELDNLRIAAEWAVLEWTEVEAREVLAGLNEFFFAHSWFDGAETFERLVSVAGGPGPASPVTLAAVAYRTYLGSALGYDEELDRLALECLPRLRELGMTWELGWCLLALGTNACYQDVYPEAAAYLEEAVAVTRSAGDGLDEVAVLMWLGFVQLLMDDLEDARASFEAACAKAERLGNPQLLPTLSASSAFLPTPRSTTRTRCACRWRRKSCSRVSETLAAPVTR